MRKVLGGGMRQAGVLAACARVALDEGIDRLAEDHARAAALAAGLGALPGAAVEPPDTNIVFVRFEDLDPDEHATLARDLDRDGVRVLAVGARGIRLVTHRQIGDDDVARTIEAFAARRAEGPPAS